MPTSSPDQPEIVRKFVTVLLSHMRSEQHESGQWIRELIRILDTISNDESTPELILFTRLYLARATLAVSHLAKRLYSESTVNIDATVIAAIQFIEKPTEHNDLLFFEAATNSYPFGPGDGCFCVDNASGHDTGSGCLTGSGFLWFIAEDVGHENVQKCLIADLIPWLAPLNR